MGTWDETSREIVKIRLSVDVIVIHLIPAPDQKKAGVGKLLPLISGNRLSPKFSFMIWNLIAGVG